VRGGVQRTAERALLLVRRLLLRRRHSHRWHASPSYPAKHRHRPVPRSHSPMLLHSARAWAVVGPVGTSTHARSAGHVPAGGGGRGVVLLRVCARPLRRTNCRRVRPAPRPLPPPPPSLPGRRTHTGLGAEKESPATLSCAHSYHTHAGSSRAPCSARGRWARPTPCSTSSGSWRCRTSRGRSRRSGGCMTPRTRAPATARRAAPPPPPPPRRRRPPDALSATPPGPAARCGAAPSAAPPRGAGAAARS
jgi:hypothetical protein